MVLIEVDDAKNKFWLLPVLIYSTVRNLMNSLEGLAD